MATKQIQITNGRETRTLEIFRRDGNWFAWDRTADPNCDSAALIADDSEASVMDSIRENGFEIAD